MNYDNLVKDAKLFEFCHKPFEEESDVWQILYPYGYLHATYLHDFWYIKYVFVYEEHRNKSFGQKLVSDFIVDKQKIIMKVTSLNAFNCYKKCDSYHNIKLYHPLHQLNLKSGKFYISNNSLMKPYNLDFISIDVDKNTEIEKEIFDMPLSPFMIVSLH